MTFEKKKIQSSYIVICMIKKLLLFSVGSVYLSGRPA